MTLWCFELQKDILCKIYHFDIIELGDEKPVIFILAEEALHLYKAPIIHLCHNGGWHGFVSPKFYAHITHCDSGI